MKTFDFFYPRPAICDQNSIKLFTLDFIRLKVPITPPEHSVLSVQHSWSQRAFSSISSGLKENLLTSISCLALGRSSPYYMLQEHPQRLCRFTLRYAAVTDAVKWSVLNCSDTSTRFGVKAFNISGGIPFSSVHTANLIYVKFIYGHPAGNCSVLFGLRGISAYIVQCFQTWMSIEK